MTTDLGRLPRKWTSFIGSRPGSSRLFCFPYAAGGASAYRAWVTKLASAGIDVWPVQLPGRESRFNEEPMEDLDTLSDILLDVFGPCLEEKPYAFFGHSMGASIAHAFARRLLSSGLSQPQHLFLSCHRPPQFPDPEGPLHALPRAQLLEKLRRYGGTPAEVLESDDLLNLYLPLLRTDLALYENADWDPAVRLSCPLTVFGATEDPTVPASVLPAWAEMTDGRFELRMVPGNHFAPFTRSEDVYPSIVRALAPRE